MDKLINGEGAYKSLTAEFDGYRWHPPLAVDIDGFWHFPRALLPERLKQLVGADRDLRAHWDWLHPHERQRLVIQLDARRDPASPDAQDEGADFEREVRRWELEVERDQHGRLDPVSSIDIEVKRLALARIAADLAQLDAEVAALDSEQADAEQQCKPAGNFTTMTGTKVEPQSATDRGPTLTSDEVSEAFDGIGLSREEWRQRLTKDRPAWLMEKCWASPGKRGNGGKQATWFVLSVARALVSGAGQTAPVPAQTLDTAFRNRSLLAPWSEQWMLIRQDNPLWG